MTTARPPLVRMRPLRQAVAGFTLMESVMVIALLAIVAAYVLPQSFNYSPLTLNAQTRNFVANLQQAQLLAITQGQQVNVQVSGNTYTVPVNMGSIGTQTVTLEPGTTFVASGVGSGYYFDSLGQPTDSAGHPTANWSFQLQTANTLGTLVSVEAISGWITGP